MPRKQKTKTKKTTRRKPLVISIHGEGIDIDATLHNVQAQGWSDILKRATAPIPDFPMPDAPDAVAMVAHDFDAVARVINNAPTVVVQSVLDLAQKQLEMRRTPAQPLIEPNGEAQAS